MIVFENGAHGVVAGHGVESLVVGGHARAGSSACGLASSALAFGFAKVGRNAAEGLGILLRNLGDGFGGAVDVAINRDGLAVLKRNVRAGIGIDVFKSVVRGGSVRGMQGWSETLRARSSRGLP